MLALRIGGAEVVPCEKFVYNQDGALALSPVFRKDCKVGHIDAVPGVKVGGTSRSTKPLCRKKQQVIPVDFVVPVQIAQHRLDYSYNDRAALKLRYFVPYLKLQDVVARLGKYRAGVRD